jgi:hypothetical protein
MATLNPLADEGEHGYIPTVDVIRVVRANFTEEYIDRIVARNLNPLTDVDELDRAVAVEIACRELLDAQRWLLSNLYE